MMNNSGFVYDFKNVRGHVEVFRNGEFLFTADTYEEAVEEIETIEKEFKKKRKDFVYE